MKKPAFFIINIIIFLAWQMACMPVRVVTDKPMEVSLSCYESYNLYPVDYKHYDSIPYNEATFDLMIEEIKKNMQGNGYRLSDDPELLLNVGIVIERELQSRETDPRYDMNYVGQRNYHWEREEKVVGFYEEGAVTIDFVNADTNMLLWQGTAIGMISSNTEKMRKRVVFAIDNIFKKVPVSNYK